MDYNIRLELSVYKELAKIDKTQSRRILSSIEDKLSRHPESYPSLKGEFEGLRWMRVGNYRVFFTILENPEPTVLILRIGHRKDVYRAF